MKQRHWDQIGQLTNKRINVEEDGFTMQDIMNANLLSYKDEIEVNSDNILVYFTIVYTIIV